MMTLDECRERIGHGVVYEPNGEQGVITSVNEHWVFVRYGSDTCSRATSSGMLTPLLRRLPRIIDLEPEYTK